MSDILPCPFCGNSDRIKISMYEGEPYFGYIVNCDASGWSAQGWHDDGRGCGANGGWGETPEEAVAIWNRRAALSQDTHSLPEGDR